MKGAQTLTAHCSEELLWGKLPGPGDPHWPLWGSVSRRGWVVTAASISC